jgi:hypothetical protein
MAVVGGSPRQRVAPMSDASVRECYDRSADAYAQHADRLAYRHLAEPLLRALEGTDGPVLDVCSGAGALGRRLARPVAVDLSRGQLTRNPVPIRVQADAMRLPFAADAFGAAGSAFGLNQVPEPARLVGEMARVAPTVAVLTWERPTEPFRPKQVVLRVIERHLGASRSPVGERIDRRTEAVGSEVVVRALLRQAGLRAEVRTTAVPVPWPGARAFVDYRLSLLGVEPLLDDPRAVRREAVDAVEGLARDDLEWCPRLVLGTGRRSR